MSSFKTTRFIAEKYANTHLCIEGCPCESKWFSEVVVKEAIEKRIDIYKNRISQSKVYPTNWLDRIDELERLLQSLFGDDKP